MKFTRRDFLKFSLLGIGASAIHIQDADASSVIHPRLMLVGEKNGVSIYKEPDESSAILYQRQYNEIINALHPYIELSIAEFVTGARNIDSGWDAYVQECERIGYKTMMEIVQRAFDRQWAETWKASHGK